MFSVGIKKMMHCGIDTDSLCVCLSIYFIHMPLYQIWGRIWAVTNEHKLFDHHGTLVALQQPKSKEHCVSLLGW